MKQRTILRSKYPFKTLLRYIPQRYASLKDWQEEQRTTITRFKNGHGSPKLYQYFADVIRKITESVPGQWVITFVPPTIGYEQEYNWRYQEITEYLKEALPHIPVIYQGVLVKEEWTRLPKSMGGKRTIEPGNLCIDTDAFKGKFVILIDDIITTGYSFRTVGDALVQAGATKIHGVILAMTIHPNLPVKSVRRNNKSFPAPSQNVKYNNDNIIINKTENQRKQ